MLFGYWFIVIGKRHEPRAHECRDGKKHHQQEEISVTEVVAQVARNGPGEHHRKVHDPRGEGVVRHLVTPRSHLLHHKERKAHEPEAVAEILHDDAAAHEPHRLRLEPRQQGVDRERQVEDTAKREKRTPQAPPGDVVPRQQRTQQKGSRTERTVVKPDLLVREAETARGRVGLEEQRYDLHHEAFAQPVQDDKGDIVSDMFLREECRDNLFQARKALPKRMMFGGGAARRKRTQVVGPQSHERGAQDHQHHRPRANRSVERRRAVRREALVEPTRQPHEAACGDQFGQVIERSLPPDILRLSRRREFRHVDTIGRDVVRGTAECHNGKDCDRDGEERRHVKRQSRDTEQHAAQQLGRNDPEFFRAVQLQKRTPQKLDRPRPHDQRCPERNLGVRNPEVLEQNRRDHVQNNERQAHSKIQTRDPAERRIKCHCYYFCR